MYLSDNLQNPRRWQFPSGTVIPARGHVLVWADEDGDASGLHASFKLSKSGETVFLVDSDARKNLILDSVEFGPQKANAAIGREADGVGEVLPIPASPGISNQQPGR